VYELIFSDWLAPGFLAAMASCGGLGRENRRATAKDEAALNQKRGYPLALHLK